MAGSYRPYEPDQVMLLPAAPQDWLPAGHLAHFINDTVDALDLKAFYARYEEAARQDAAIASAEAVVVKLVRRNTRLTHRNALRAGSTDYPSDSAAAVLAMIRIGLGDRTVRYPAMAARMGEPFLKKIELAVQRVGAVAGVPQERLPLQYR